MLDCWPNRHYSSVAEQAHDDCAALTCFFDAEECFAWLPAVVDGFFESLALALANDYVKTVVAEVHALAWTLYAVADNGNCFIFQYFSCFLKSEFFAGDYLFFNTAKI